MSATPTASSYPDLPKPHDVVSRDPGDTAVHASSKSRPAASWLHRVILNLTLSICSMAIGLALMELTIRLLPLWPDRVSAPDPELGYSHIPGARGWWVNVATPFEFKSYVEINQLGLHDREISIAKPSGVSRILLLGDSITDGLEVGWQRTFAKDVERRAQVAGRAIEVINGGHYGYGTDQELLFYRLRGLELDPDVVVLCITLGNDLEDNLSINAISDKPYFTLNDAEQVELHNFPVQLNDVETWSSSPFSAIKAFMRDHLRLYHFIGFHLRHDLPSVRGVASELGVMRTEGAETGAAGLSSADLEQSWKLTTSLVDELRRTVERDGKSFVVAVMPYPLQFTASAASMPRHDRMMQVCAELQLECVDMYPVFSQLVAEGMFGSLFYPTDGHPTAIGHARIGEALYGYLNARVLPTAP